MIHLFCRLASVLMLTGFVAACAASPEQQAQRDADRCTEHGFKPNTKEHDDCIASTQARRDDRLEQRHRDLVEAPPPVYGGR